MSDLAELLAKIDRECAEHEAKFPTLSLATLFYVRDIRALLQHIAAEPARIRAAVEAARERAAGIIAAQITEAQDWIDDLHHSRTLDKHAKYGEIDALEKAAAAIRRGE